MMDADQERIADQQLLEKWYNAAEAAEEAKKVIAAEQKLRLQVFAAFCPAPVEGVNKIEVFDGWTLKATYKLDRKIDEAALPAVTEQLREMGVSSDMLVQWKPALKTATYRELTEEQRRVFDQALVIKPASPSLELVNNQKGSA